MATVESNKAKIAKRVVEVLEFFDDDHPHATVMDIVRRYNRPQSSTSELLSSLVGLGLLYKDPYSRSYTPTPRAALLGCSVQSGIVRSGRLSSLIDRLSAQTGLGVAVLGMVGLSVQIFSWRGGKYPLRTSQTDGFCGGQQEALCDSAAGLLLLSTVLQPRRDGMLRRLNAEATDDRKFSVADAAARIQRCSDDGHAHGVAGFGSIADLTALLLPDQPAGQPLAIALVYEPAEAIDPEVLRQTIAAAIALSSADVPHATDNVALLAGVA
jgi:DNA-binding IclR family transcriptional regulator